MLYALACPPEQASGILGTMSDPMRISHEAIYTALYAMPRGELRAAILALLPRGHKTRRPRSSGTDRRGLIPGAISIDERPIEVDELLVPGHWEGDLIKGARNKSQIGTLVERTTLFTMLVQLDNATAERFASVLNRIDAAMCLSMTYDTGREMARHKAHYPKLAASKSTSLTLTALGSADAMTTPMTCCEGCYPKEQT